jgi:peptidyl-prolyl cis-trans isomerase D
MFDFIRQHTRWVLAFVVLLIFPSFVFFGVQGYTSFLEGGRAEVASVDGQAITQAEWDAAHQRNVERMRQQMPGVDAKLFDSPEARQQSLDALVRERVLLNAAQSQHLLPSDQRLKRLFESDPQFASLRNPDGSVNRDILAAQGMSSEMLAQQLKLEMGMNQVVNGLTASALAPKAVVDVAIQAVLQRREVQGQRFAVSSFEAQVKPDDAALQAHYQANAEAFRRPEQARIAYVVLDAEQLKKNLSVTEEDLRKYYTENAARYTLAEQRRASHILIKLDSSASAADKQKAKERADALLAQVRSAPARFADIARESSEDPGSAPQGGDLDFFGRGAMVKPFEDAVFGMQPGEISPLIQSDFGYHIIRLEGVRGGEKKPFEQVRTEVEEEVRRQLAQRRYAETAEQFTNAVYEQADSLQPAVERFKLELREATVQRQPAPGAEGPLASQKLLDAVFSDDALRNKRNTDAVDLGGSRLVSARVIEHLPSKVLALEEVKDRVRAAVVSRQAADLARKAGESLLAQLKSESGHSLPPVQIISRAQADLPSEVVQAVLRADATKLPLALGVPLADGGYWAGRVTRVLPADPATVGDPAVPQQFARLWAAAEAAAYYEALKQQHGVEIKPAAAKKDTAGR